MDEGFQMMKLKTCRFTGHRHLPENQKNEISAKLEKVTLSLIYSGYLYFGKGSALGLDTLCAKTILRLRQNYPRIKLIVRKRDFMELLWQNKSELNRNNRQTHPSHKISLKKENP